MSTGSVIHQQLPPLMHKDRTKPTLNGNGMTKWNSSNGLSTENGYQKSPTLVNDGGYKSEDSDDEDIFLPSDGAILMRMNSFNSDDFHDAADLLDDYSSDDDVLSSGSFRSRGRSPRIGSYQKTHQRLQEEIAKRIAAEKSLEDKADEFRRLKEALAILKSSDDSGAVNAKEGLPAVQENRNYDASEVRATNSIQPTVSPVEADEQEAAAEDDQELLVARLVAGAIARGAAKSVAAEELEEIIEKKDREISRLKDKLQFWEIMNLEMSQRNSETIGGLRERRRMWRTIGRVILTGTAIAAGIGATLYATSTFASYDNDSSLLEASPDIDSGLHEGANEC